MENENKKTCNHYKEIEDISSSNKNDKDGPSYYSKHCHKQCSQQGYKGTNKERYSQHTILLI